MAGEVRETVGGTPVITLPLEPPAVTDTDTVGDTPWKPSASVATAVSTLSSAAPVEALTFWTGVKLIV